ncbi:MULTISPECIES: superoxide dismutase [unclassified Photobacterium]|uniref:superoxide dismutase n=1 Tax=unclassified Photobacterium TaxID=2628852 RepID=UPI000D15E1FD|nr:MULTISPECIES: superoxide dismutase [unclassified Photobacterium]PSV24135.1 superoxide dismutase [Photobacterium sp. GB-56]PSV32382.1 superoxide dismutase [Photobacterium sp. GB-72]PSV38918.1 superoxide dismutase [Photobacterium sp. GB-27]PSV47041.1 superoxide dismutase [Photobacterium sp. GB-36]PSV54722.1 superoxide dismutase [Photobacterium sp. GB-1]
MKHLFPKLPYGFNALEPYLDAKTVEIHYSKHHRGYFDKFIAAIENTDLTDQPIETILSNISQYPAAVRNNGGGFYNHNLYWQCMSPEGVRHPSGLLAEAINAHFESFAKFKETFSTLAANHFGAGFIWLSVVDGRLEISATPNQDNPLMDTVTVQGTPILALDVWEHAYYLSYQNVRPDYIDAWWHLVDWEQVEMNYLSALQAF